MATLTVKNIPDELYERIKESAAEHRRSINSEIIVCLERALASRRMDPEALLARADALRERAALSPLTEDTLGEARRRIVGPTRTAESDAAQRDAAAGDAAERDTAERDAREGDAGESGATESDAG
ncbi:MAG TPA: Arc family DNA-binding protein [Gemmatimonadaceae bacterium]|nr:Arc family DNA-binding protein [Gemmatimonadaceae bacterium]